MELWEAKIKHRHDDNRKRHPFKWGCRFFMLDFVHALHSWIQIVDFVFGGIH